MKKKNKFNIGNLLYAISACAIVMLALVTVLKSERENYNDAEENYEVEVSNEPKIDDYVTLSVDIEGEGRGLDIAESKIETVSVETEPIEIEEVKYQFTERYRDIDVTPYDIDLMAAVVHHESDNQCFAGQRMVAEVILNRVLQGDMGGTTINDVIYAKNQFFYVTDDDVARANEINYQAVYAALNETPITDEDVVYFALSPHNNSVFAKVGAHYFCYKW